MRPRTVPSSVKEAEARQAAEAREHFRQLRAQGLHSDAFETVCEACREWCDGYYFVTFDGQHICKACYLHKQGKAK